MVLFINRLTGTEMRVSDDRAEEYKAAGHIPVAEPPKEEKPKKTRKKKV